MANIAVARIKREFKEVIKSEEVSQLHHINLCKLFLEISCLVGDATD